MIKKETAEQLYKRKKAEIQKEEKTKIIDKVRALELKNKENEFIIRSLKRQISGHVSLITRLNNKIKMLESIGCDENTRLKKAKEVELKKDPENVVMLEHNKLQNQADSLLANFQCIGKNRHEIKSKILEFLKRGYKVLANNNVVYYFNGNEWAATEYDEIGEPLKTRVHAAKCKKLTIEDLQKIFK